MSATIKLMNTSITSHGCLICWRGAVSGTLEMGLLSNTQAYNTVLLTIGTMFNIRSCPLILCTEKLRPREGVTCPRTQRKSVVATGLGALHKTSCSKIA